MKNSILILLFLLSGSFVYSQDIYREFDEAVQKNEQRKQEIDHILAEKESQEDAQTFFVILGVTVGIGLLLYVLNSTKQSNVKNSEISEVKTENITSKSLQSSNEITVQQTDIWKVSLIIILPLVLTFLLQHTNDVQTFQMAHISGIHSIEFKTFFGNIISEHDRSVLSNVTYNFDGLPYNEKLPYYFQGLIKDIIYPISLSVIILILFVLKKRYKINIQ